MSVEGEFGSLRNIGVRIIGHSILHSPYVRLLQHTLNPIPIIPTQVS